MNNNKLSNVNKTIEDTHTEYIIEGDDTFERQKSDFVKYEKPIINSINQMAGGTKPAVVGQMSLLVPKFRDESLKNGAEISPDNWKKWYLKNHTENYNNAIKKATRMAENYKRIINEIDEESIAKWMNNFMFIENIEGLLIQDEIMEYIIKKYPKYNVRAATPAEEGKNIDIIVNGSTYQVKPLTQKQGTAFNQKWGDEKAIWYKKAQKDKKLVYKFYLPNELKKNS